MGDEDRFVGALTIAGPSERLRRVDAARFERLILPRARALAQKLGAFPEPREVLYAQDVAPPATR